MRAVMLVALLVAFAGLSACNTVKGLGEDIQSVGEAADREI